MESNSCTKVCRFCLETKSNFETIEEVTLANLDFLWLKLNLTISEEPVMCGDCALNIAISSDFKTKCLEIENCIVPFAEDKDSTKIHLREVYVSKMSLENIVNVPEVHIVCRLCLKLAKNGSAIFLKNSTDIVEKLYQYFPELDLTCTDDPAICASCQVSLHCHFSFINTCLTTEEKITEYCKVDGINGKCQIDLNSLIDFVLSKDFLKCKFEVGTVKIEGTCNEDSENANNVVEIKKEDIVDMDVKEDSSSQESELTNENSFQHHPSSSLSDQNNIRYRLQEHMQKHTNAMDSFHSAIPAVRGTMLKCYYCDYEAKRKSRLREHMLTHKSPSEITMHKCETCTFETKHKNYLHRHRLTHMAMSDTEMHKCDLCDLVTKLKSSLKRHMLTHKPHSEVTMYKCERCDYETKWKLDLKRHMVIHKTPSEITMYKCETCTFETKHKDYLHKHRLIHMNVSEIKMHKCEVCPFQTKWKKCFRQHLISHHAYPVC